MGHDNYYLEIEKTKNEIKQISKMIPKKSGIQKIILGQRLELQRQHLHYLHRVMNETNKKVTHIKPEKVNFEKIQNKHQKIKVILQYYDEPNFSRKLEILQSINNNIQNNFIDECVIFIECNELSKPFGKLKRDLIQDKKNNFIETDKRLTYQDAIDYAKKEAEKNVVYLVINNDCYFDESIQQIKKVDFKSGNRLLCFTRHDQMPDGSIERGKSPPLHSEEYVWGEDFELDRSNWGLLDYNCADAWAFTCDITEFDCDLELGTFNCEYYFAESAYLNGIDLRNPSEYIKCIHIHNTNLRRRYALDNEVTANRINKMYPNEIHNPRNSENWIVGTWRLRSKYNYIDKDQEYQEYTDYVVKDFNDICR